MRRDTSTRPVLLSELLQVPPLSAAEAALPADLARPVQQVVLAETFDRLRASTPESLVVVNAEAATGGWSLAAALHISWQRNVSAVVVPHRVAGPANLALAARLDMPLLMIDEDPLDVALQVASLVSAPAATRALRQATCAERLANESTIRGVLGVLNGELAPVPVGVEVAGAVVAGRSVSAARPGAVRVSVDIEGPGGQPWARLVAAAPDDPTTLRQVETMLRIARPALQAAWAQTRLDSAMHAAHEEAAFRMLRDGATAPVVSSPGPEPTGTPAPEWTGELGWQLGAHNRAVWFAATGTPAERRHELTHLVRSAWQQGQLSWPFIADGDGWLSWHSSATADEAKVLRKALRGFETSAAAYGLAVGVGREHDGVDGLLRSVTEARVAATVARDIGPGAVQWFEQVGARAALAWLPVSELADVARFCLTDLLAARDAQQLVETLLATLDGGGSLATASQRLGVHRNTVRARLSRARHLGVSLDDPSERLAVHVMCYALAAAFRMPTNAPS